MFFYQWLRELYSNSQYWWICPFWLAILLILTSVMSLNSICLIWILLHQFILWLMVRLTEMHISLHLSFSLLNTCILVDSIQLNSPPPPLLVNVSFLQSTLLIVDMFWFILPAYFGLSIYPAFSKLLFLSCLLLSNPIFLLFIILPFIQDYRPPPFS